MEKLFKGRGEKIDYLNHPLRDDIINRFLSGEIIMNISKHYDISTNTVNNFIKKNGYGDKIRVHKYPVFEDFFKYINCVERSWILGWLMADGYVYNNRIGISLHKQDIDIIQKISAHFNFKGLHNKDGNKIGIGIYNKIMAADLAELGCIPKKSLVLKFPTQIESNYIRHFIRGYFEGDGCVSLNKKRNYITISFKGTLEFLTGIRDALTNSIGINCSLIKPKNCIGKNTFDLKISGNIQSVKFLNWIYSNTDESIRLNRKYNKSKELYSYMTENRQKPVPLELKY